MVKRSVTHCASSYGAYTLAAAAAVVVAVGGWGGVGRVSTSACLNGVQKGTPLV
mgnify:FL=1